MSSLDFLDDILPAPTETRAPIRHECGVNVTVCEWSDEQWAEHGHIVDSIHALVSGFFSMAFRTQEMEEEILQAFGDHFAEVQVDITELTEFQVTLITHGTAADIEGELG